MQAYDIVVLVLLIAATVWGARHGFAKQLASLASLVVGYVVAVQFRQPLAAMIDATPPWNVFAAMLILFMGTSLGIWLAFQLIQGTIEKLGLKYFDQQMGGLFGLLKGVVICMALTMFVVVMAGDRFRDEVLRSHSGYSICRALMRAQALVPAEWQEKIEPYLNELDQLALDQGASAAETATVEEQQVIEPLAIPNHETIRPNRSAGSTATRPWPVQPRR
jgi:membrane protein required for colicin V production